MADIVLKDRNGNDITYPGINLVQLKTTDGGTQTFAACEDVEKTVAPDFSKGDMEVVPDEGTLLAKVTIEKPETLLPENVRSGVEVAGVTGRFIGDTEEATVELALADGNQVVSPSANGKVISKVTIVKPETLLPENIAEGIDIAGIVGTLAANGGNFVFKDVRFTPTSNNACTVEHGLGVTPDIVLMKPRYDLNKVNYGFLWFGISSALYEAGVTLPRNMVLWQSSSGVSTRSYVSGINVGTTTPIHSANETTVSFKSQTTTTDLFDTSQQYTLYCIGGLT